MTRRVVIACAVVFAAAAVSGIIWLERPEARSADNTGLTLTRPPGLAIDAAVKGRSEVVTTGSADRRVPKARVRLGLAVLVGVSLVMAAAITTLTRPSPALRRTLWRRSSVSLRAPPLPKLS